MRRLLVAWKYFTEASLFFLHIRKDQDHIRKEQSDCKLWFYCNKQKNDYLQW